MAQLFGRYEAAALLAVEQANGGELAALEQVVLAFEGLFGSSVTPATFSEAVGLLVDAYLVEWRDFSLGLTVKGRRLIRRSGAHWSEDFPDKVADQLGEIEEGELAGEGELAAPSESDILSAMQALGRGQLGGTGLRSGGALSPSGLAQKHTLGARLLEGLPAGLGINVGLPFVPPRPEEAAERGEEDEPAGPGG